MQEPFIWHVRVVSDEYVLGLCLGSYMEMIVAQTVLVAVGVVPGAGTSAYCST